MRVRARDDQLVAHLDVLEAHKGDITELCPRIWDGMIQRKAEENSHVV